MKVFSNDLTAFKSWFAKQLVTGNRREVVHVINNYLEHNATILDTYSYVQTLEFLSLLNELSLTYGSQSKAHVDVAYLPSKLVNSVLDIGTVYTEYLDALQNRLSAEYVRGVNVSDSISYGNSNIEQDPRFMLYNGNHIPDSIVPTNGFDVINIRMTLHHISNYLPLLRSCYNACSRTGAIYILDHDYNRRDTKYSARVDMLDFVHDVYDYALNTETRYRLAELKNQELSAILPVDSNELIVTLENLGFKVDTLVSRSYKDTYMSKRLWIASRKL